MNDNRNNRNNRNKINRNETELNNKDNISKKRKKKPSKVGNIVSMIFYVNFKILSYIINIALTVLLVGIITGGIVAGAFALYVKNYIDPTMDELTVMSSSSNLTTFMYYYDYEDRFNKQITEYDAEKDPRWIVMDSLHGSENRMWVSYAQMPENLINAFIALEDKRFMSHKGVDWLRTISAARTFFLPSEGERVLGGSTITQQLVKMITKDDDVRIQRKIQEILRALYLESKQSKDEIMETYLNTINLSSGCYGVQAAANTFFNKDVSELNLIECAAIASIVQSPTAMNPIKRPERNKDRRDECLKNMLEYGMITQEEYDAAFDKELVINRPENTYIEEVNSYYVDQIIEDVQADLMKKFNYTLEMASNRLFSGGLRIYSCMDNYIQSCMEAVYADDKYFPTQAETAILYQSAMVVLDPYTGELMGIVGGRRNKVQRGLNRASGSTRQPGSAIKPMSVYTPALERGLINWGTPLYDSPPFTYRGKPWPQNYPIGNEGYISLSLAVANSKNTIAAKVLDDLGSKESFRFCYDELNIHSLVESMTMPNGQIKSDIDVGPLALGGLTKGVSVYELTSAYMILANKGIYSTPHSYSLVTDQDGNIILDNRQPEQRIVISEATAAIMTKLLRGVIENPRGTAKGMPMKGNVQIAGKTGTTNEDYDRWFIGYTPYYLGGCWFGYDKNKYLGVGVGGLNPPMLLWNYVMNEIHKPIYENPKTFEDSLFVVEAPYCQATGMAPGPYCRKLMGYYASGAEPMELCNYPAHSSDYVPPEETTEPVSEETNAAETATETTTNVTVNVPAETEPAEYTDTPNAPVIESTEPPTIAPETTMTESITIGTTIEHVDNIITPPLVTENENLNIFETMQEITLAHEPVVTEAQDINAD